MFCHHQHAGEFGLGKSEVVGLAGDPDQNYASELAELEFVTIAPDASGSRSATGVATVCRPSPGSNSAPGSFKGGHCWRTACSTSRPLSMSLLNVMTWIPSRLGFLGHSYGGKAALWSAAYDTRIKATASHCGCIPYRLTVTRDTGIQAEFVLPGFAQVHDLDDVIAMLGKRAL